MVGCLWFDRVFDMVLFGEFSDTRWPIRKPARRVVGHMVLVCLAYLGHGLTCPLCRRYSIDCENILTYLRLCLRGFDHGLFLGSCVSDPEMGMIRFLEL